MYKHIRAIITTSFTIFAMLFGAGNLMFPIHIGSVSGSHTLLAFTGFALSGILLPVLGLLTIVAFQGNYSNFFARLGQYAGRAFILCCMFVIGPFIVMPRMVTLSHEMLAPFMPTISSGAFGVIFCTLVFFATYKPSRLLDIIGYILSPLKFTSIAGIVGYGVISGYTPEATELLPSEVFSQAFVQGYETLDVLGAIFFGSIVVKLLTEFVPNERQISTKEAVKVTGIASVCAAGLLALVYLGMTYLGAFHGYGLLDVNAGQLFSVISRRVLGESGGALIGITVFLACFTTTVTLTTVVSEYTQRVLTRNQWPYAACVAAVLALCVCIASFGLGPIIDYSKPFIQFFYPLVVVTMICNLLYKAIHFTPVRIPVAMTAAILGVYQFVWPYISVVTDKLTNIGS